MATIVHRLEQGLRAYEDWCLEQAICKKVGLIIDADAEPLSGALLHWQDFRSYVLKYASRCAEVEDVYSVEKFETDSFLRPLNEVARYVQIPLLISAWCASSRRVFHLADELQLLLSATKLDGVKWNDIDPPFGSFVITLDTPILDVHSRAFDTIGYYSALHPDTSEMSFDFVLLPAELADVKPLSAFNKQNWARAIARRDLHQLKHLLHCQDGLRQYPMLSWTSEYLADRDRLVMDSLARPFKWDLVEDGERVVSEGIDPSLRPELVVAMRLVAGLCIYLKSLPPGETHTSSWNPLSKTQKLDARAISNGAQICTVASRFRVPQEHVRAFREGKGGYEISAHWREGHYRRRPGMGNDPAAPRVIWVRPTLVRKDRLRPGELPGGSIAKVG